MCFYFKPRNSRQSHKLFFQFSELHVFFNKKNARVIGAVIYNIFFKKVISLTPKFVSTDFFDTTTAQYPSFVSSATLSESGGELNTRPCFKNPRKSARGSRFLREIIFYADNFLLPLFLRRLRVFLPPLVRARTKKPCVRALFFFLGL